MENILIAAWSGEVGMGGKWVWLGKWGGHLCIDENVLYVDCINSIVLQNVANWGKLDKGYTKIFLYYFS